MRTLGVARRAAPRPGAQGTDLYHVSLSVVPLPREHPQRDGVPEANYLGLHESRRGSCLRQNQA
jgi:hypothetical protein